MIFHSERVQRFGELNQILRQLCPSESGEGPFFYLANNPRPKSDSFQTEEGMGVHKNKAKFFRANLTKKFHKSLENVEIKNWKAFQTLKKMKFLGPCKNFSMIASSHENTTIRNLIPKPGKSI